MNAGKRPLDLLAPVVVKRVRVASLSASATTVQAPVAVSAPLPVPSRPSGFTPQLFSASLSHSPPLADGKFTVSERDLLSLECATLDPSWLELLQDEIRKPYFLALKNFLWSEGVTDDAVSVSTKVFPAAKDIYSWSRHTPIDNVRVVILGQDPYHGPRQAHGLSFSVPSGVPIPPSLRNIYKELKTEFPSFTVPTHGNLMSFANSGVLLLNTCLTVRNGQAGSHSNRGWETFTDRIIDLVDEFAGKDGKGVVFLAWGAWAAKRVAKLNRKKHLILTSPHPSPLSARRGFFGCGHFAKANEWLETTYGPSSTIDWTRLDAHAS